MRNNGSNITRRKFMETGLTAATLFTIVPAHVLAGSGNTAPSDKLNIAGVGVGGVGANNLSAAENENIVALCDVDKEFAAHVFKKYPKAKIWTDFREMLDQQKDIDGVIIATPDHLHAIVSKTAMEMGKHVYTEKPLTRTIEEGRILLETAKRTGVATQMGNQGHSSDVTRKVREYIEDGVIGNISEIHCWTSTATGKWPQGIGKPTSKPSVPSYLDWDLWLGPAPFRNYHPVYHPNRWRGWWDFGNGALGDMACHVMDPAFYALNLGSPDSITAIYTGLESREGLYELGQGFTLSMDINGDIFPVQKSCSGPDAQTSPISCIVRYEFHAKNGNAPVSLTWWDGGLRPPILHELGQPVRGTGSLIIGDKGSISCSSHGRDMILAPENLRKEYQPPGEKYKRIKGENHMQDWIVACKRGRSACSNFEYAVPLNEMVLLGSLALRTGERIEWDAGEMKATNAPEAEQYIKVNNRKGWEL